MNANTILIVGYDTVILDIMMAKIYKYGYKLYFSVVRNWLTMSNMLLNQRDVYH